MALTLSDVEIFNSALDYLKNAPIVSFDDEDDVAAWGKRNYPILRDSLMRSQMWNFARTTWELNRMVDEPLGPWKYQFRLPNNYLRIEPIQEKGVRYGRRIPYELRGYFIVTDYEENPLIVNGMRRVENAGEFSPMFANLLSITLALKAANFITGKASLIPQLQGLQADMADNVRKVEGQESPYSVPRPDQSMPRDNRRFYANRLNPR